MHGLGNQMYQTSQSIRIARQGVTLLLVDDNAAVREILQTVLLLEGYNVLTAPDGESAISFVSETHIDMLITDFQMPGMNGYELAVHLSTQRSALPVLVISGSDLEELPLQDLSHRGWNFLSKPMKNIEMMKIIDSACLYQAIDREHRSLQAA